MNEIIREDCEKNLKKINLKKIKDSTILLTGSNGLLGRYIVHTVYLANKKYNSNCKIYCVSLHGPSYQIKKLLDDKNIIQIKADLTKPFNFKENLDYVFHAACYAQPKLWLNDKIKTIYLNVNTTKLLLDIAYKNNAKFMFFSSQDVYGDIPKEFVPVKENYNGNLSTIAPRSAYGESKRLGETICSIYRNDLKLKTYIIRISHTYGPGVSIHDERVLGNFINKAIFNKKINMLDEGKSVKMFGYIADIIYMILRVMLDGKDFIYNIGGKNKISIKELAEIVAKYCDNIPVIPSKKKSKFEHIGTDPDYVGLNISKFEKEFGKVDFMDFHEGIKRTINWNIKEFNLGDIFNEIP